MPKFRICILILASSLCIRYFLLFRDSWKRNLLITILSPLVWKHFSCIFINLITSSFAFLTIVFVNRRPPSYQRPLQVTSVVLLAEVDTWASSGGCRCSWRSPSSGEPQWLGVLSRPRSICSSYKVMQHSIYFLCKCSLYISVYW